MTDDESLEFYHGWLNRVPEYLGLVALGALVALTYQGAVTLPARIPTHFGASGAVNAWGPKSTIYVLVGIAVVLYAVLTLAQRVPRMFNYPVKVTDENRPRLQLIALGMLRWTKAEMVAMFAYIQWAVVQVGTHHAATMSGAGMVTLLVALLATEAFFIVWMVRAR